MRIFIRKLGLVAAAIVGAVAVLTSQVAAAESDSVDSRTTITSSGSDQVGALATCTRYGYTRTFLHGCTLIYDVDWFGSTSRKESFGIAPDRTIWHAWPGSGGWREMPGNGRADQVVDSGWNYADGQYRRIEVWVSNGTWWCSDDYATTNWSSWYRC